MTIRSIWHINDDQTREDTRLAPNGVYTPGDSSALATTSGVVPTQGNPLNLTSTAEMTAQVEIGRAVVQGLVTQGAYPVVVTNPEPLTFDDGDASNPRIDTVAIVIRDDPYDSTGETSVTVEVVKGAASSTPSAPTLPTAASLALWDVQVDAGTSAGSGGIDWGSNLTDRRSYIVAIGGISVGNQDGSYAGQFRDSGGATGTLSRYNGTSWESALRLDSNGTLAIGDIAVTRDSTVSALAVAGAVEARRSGVTTLWAFAARKPSESNPTWYVTIDGAMWFGSGGSSTADTNLYRSASNTLKTDDTFQAGITTVTSGLTAGSGFSVTSFDASQTCGVATVHIALTRTGSTLSPTVTDGTNISGDPTVCTLPVGWRPRNTLIVMADISGTQFACCTVNTDGTILVKSVSANGTGVPNGGSFNMGFGFTL